jgi:hypothetical protein
MPFAPMLKELRSRTGGRILRSDHNLKHPKTDLKPGLAMTWKPSTEMVDGFTGRSLYLDYFVPLK